LSFGTKSKSFAFCPWQKAKVWLSSKSCMVEKLTSYRTVKKRSPMTSSAHLTFFC
jgi:hypothetical protein